MTSSDHFFPAVALVSQRLHHAPLEKLQEAVQNALDSLSVKSKTQRGESVAIAVGSRGIHRIDETTRLCVQYLSAIGLQPMIVPAMGSHGGATPKGQEEVLSKLGILESTIGAPIESSMATQTIGETVSGMEIPFSRAALQADHIVVINRVKPHTKFKADIESGLCKMLTVGLGKAVGAATYHRHAVGNSFDIIQEAATVILAKCPVLFGLALLEDGCGNLSHIELVHPETWIAQEKALLRQAYATASRIPFTHVDLLVVDYIGKNISGIGMDSKVTGRHRDITGDFFTAPHIKRIFARDLSPDSDGNGNGIGLADFTTDRLVAALDFQKTYANALAAISPEKAAVPVHFPSDRMVLEACAQSIGMESLRDARLVRIKNTASLGTLQISHTLEKEIQNNETLSLKTSWSSLEFDPKGNLIPLPE